MTDDVTVRDTWIQRTRDVHGPFEVSRDVPHALRFDRIVLRELLAHARMSLHHISSALSSDREFVVAC